MLCLLLWQLAPPAHSLAFFDPDFTYFFSFIQLGAGETISYVDHPGALLNLLGFLAMKTRHLLLGGHDSLATSFFAEPTAYHQFVHRGLFALLPASQIWAGWRLAQLGVPALWAILVLLLPFSLFSSLDYMMHVSPEVLLLALGICLVPCVLGASDSDPARARWSVIGTGILLGCMFGLKANSLPLVACLFLLRDRRQLLLCGAFALLALAGTTAPIWSELPRLAAWYWDLATHAGTYGQGPEAVTTLSAVFGNFNLLTRSAFSFTILPALAMAAAGLCARGSGERAMPRWPVALGLLVLFLLVLKHPAHRYFIAGLPLIGLLVCRLSTKPQAWAAGALAIVLATSAYSAARIGAWNRQVAKNAEEVLRLVDGPYSACALTLVGSALHPAFALNYGLYLAAPGPRRTPYSRELGRRFPLVYFLGQDNFYNFSGQPAREEWLAHQRAHSCGIFVGRVSLVPELVQRALGSPPVISPLHGHVNFREPLENAVFLPPPASAQ